jgi:hypothetical protein
MHWEITGTVVEPRGVPGPGRALLDHRLGIEPTEVGAEREGVLV